jgi:hypothetical protein
LGWRFGPAQVGGGGDSVGWRSGPAQVGSDDSWADGQAMRKSAAGVTA